MLRKAPTAFTRARRRTRWIRRSVAATGVVVTLLGWTAIDEALTIDRVRVNERVIPRARIVSWAERYRDRWEDTELTLLVDDHPHRLSRAALGATLSVDELLASVERVSENSSEDEVPTVFWTPDIDRAKLLEATFDLRERITPVDDEGLPPPGQRRLDLHGSLDVLKETLPTASVVATLPTRAPVLRGTVAGARPGTFSQLVGQHTSSYRKVGRSWSRGHNIEQGAKMLDGVIIEPFGELSFNEVVGNRSFQRGFMPANEIARGRIVDGIGGGVCQVATALHAAALRAGFDVLEHYVHSKRPRYAGRGFDTAVAWGLKDLRVRNPYPDYVRIRGEAHSGTLTIGLWSGQQPPEVDISTKIVSGTLGQRQRPLVVERVRTVRWPDGTRTDRRPLRYPAEPKD